MAIRGERLPQPGPLHRYSQKGFDPQSFQARCATPPLRHPQKMPESLPVGDGEVHGVGDDTPRLDDPVQDSDEGRSTPTTTSPTKRRPTPPPRKQLNPVSLSKSHKQRLSPPLAEGSIDDPFTWHDHEITGHNPTDPADDGYGINGVGFKPTAAIAWARSQKRQKQVAEWKSREAREAREKRRARRNEGIGLDKLHGIHEGAIQKRVKFDV